MSGKTAHIISHSHWDREWYMPYEKHHVRLIELMDTLIDLFENDPEFKSFHLDGQTIVLEDYLQIRPERRGIVKRLVEEGKLIVGPWYVLQDEFLTSSEANIRNLLTGHKDAKEYGAVCKVGYFPDSFGNMGQAPQILRQAGIDNAIFGRGVKPVGFNNETLSNFESHYSEMNWQSPDGSTVLGILFANWYNNGMEIPADQDRASGYWKSRFEGVERFASTSHLLFMNGCDHQPVQTDLSEALRVAKAIYGDIEFIHSNFVDYIESVRKNLPENLSTVQGELRSQQTDGWWTLANCASSRVYIKQANQKGQTLLEKTAEPLAAFAHLLGRQYPRHLLTYAWKTLMQNHPHDSICGCSVDEVHREMMTRFAKSFAIGEEIRDASLEAIVRVVDTQSAFGDISEDAIPFVVVNTSGWDRSEVVSAVIEVEKVSYDQRTSHSIFLDNYSVIDSNGQRVDAVLEDLGVAFIYTLPKDRFRQPYFAHRIGLKFLAENVPALGYSTYACVKTKNGTAAVVDSEPVSAKILENEYLRVDIADDGSYRLTDKRNNRIYQELGVYEDVADVGNEYIFRQPEGDQALTTRGLKAEIRLIERTPFHTAVQIVHRWALPESADETLDRDRLACVSFFRRNPKRSGKMVPMTITTTLTLEKGSSKLGIKTELRNGAKDHRLRVLFPTGIDTAVHRADSVFEAAIRDNQPSREWKNPSNCQHQQAFVNVSDTKGGLTISNLGLNEYEVLRDGRNSIAITLLRAVGELGDWGVFLTPEAQCIGDHTFEYNLIPHVEGGMVDSFAAAYQSQIPWVIGQTSVHSGSLPPVYRFLSWCGDNLAFSTCKIAEECDDLILRWFNITSIAGSLKAAVPEGTHGYISNVLEDKGEVVDIAKGISVRPAEIVTIRVSKQ